MQQTFCHRSRGMAPIALWLFQCDQFTEQRGEKRSRWKWEKQSCTWEKTEWQTLWTRGGDFNMWVVDYTLLRTDTAVSRAVGKKKMVAMDTWVTKQDRAKLLVMINDLCFDIIFVLFTCHKIWILTFHVVRFKPWPVWMNTTLIYSQEW